MQYIIYIYKNINFLKQLKNKGRNKNIQKNYLTKTQFSYKKIKNLYRINYFNSCSYIKCLVKFSIIKKTSKILNLWILYNGCFFYNIASVINKLFQLSFFILSFFISKFYLISNSFFIFQLLKIKKISLINPFINNKQIYVKYARSIGSFAKIITWNFSTWIVLIELKSKKKKFFSMFSLSSPFFVKKFFKKKLINSKASFKRLWGKKPIVRGIAKNAIDHPHGGNTKTIRLFKTPWGKSFKNNK